MGLIARESGWPLARNTASLYAQYQRILVKDEFDLVLKGQGDIADVLDRRLEDVVLINIADLVGCVPRLDSRANIIPQPSVDWHSRAAEGKELTTKSVHM